MLTYLYNKLIIDPFIHKNSLYNDFINSALYSLFTFFNYFITKKIFFFIIQINEKTVLLKFTFS